MNIIGIDPGLKGGYAEVNALGQLCAAGPTPIIAGSKPTAYDEVAMYELLASTDATHLFLEKCQTYPHDGRVSAFRTGFGYGLWRMAAVAAYMPYTLVHPQTWKRTMLPDTDRSKKASSILRAKQLFPRQAEMFIVGKRGRCHDGMCEAALIAYYGMLMLRGQTATKGE